LKLQLSETCVLYVLSVATRELCSYVADHETNSSELKRATVCKRPDIKDALNEARNILFRRIPKLYHFRI